MNHKIRRMFAGFLCFMANYNVSKYAVMKTAGEFQ